VNRAQRRYRNGTSRPDAIVTVHRGPSSWARDDAKWFGRRPDRSHRARPRLPDEWFVEPGDAPDSDWVAVRQIEPGIRVRSPFEVPASPCAGRVREAAEQEHGAAALFALASRGAGPIRCDVLPTILEQRKAPGRAHALIKSARLAHAGRGRGFENEPDRKHRDDPLAGAPREPQ
jgi:hypothetical protein